MNLFSWLPTGLFNEVDLTFPTTVDELTTGRSPFKDLLGQKFQLSKTRAAEKSKTSVATLGEGEFQFVRLDSAQTAAIGTAVRGRPVFWADEALFVVTTDCTLTSRFAGFLLETVSAKGNMTCIQISGRVGGLYGAALTKAVPTIGNLCIFNISGGVAGLDVLADATAVTCAIANQFAHARCTVLATPTAATVTEVLLLPGASLHYEGVI